MTRKLEEVFDMRSLQSIHDIEDDIEPLESDDSKEYNIAEMTDLFNRVDQINASLPTVRGLETLDTELDEIKNKSMAIFDEIIDFGKNVENKNAPAFFDSAAKMLNAAITATQSKMDRKLKAIQLQINKQKIDLERDKLEWRKEEFRLSGAGAKDIPSDDEEGMSRNELLKRMSEIVNDKVNKIK